MKRIFTVLVFFMTCGGLTGCSILGEYGRTLYEDSNAITAGAIIENPLGLYRVVVPEDYFFKEQNSYNLELQQRGGINLRKYSIFAGNAKTLPPEVINNLERSLAWTKTKIHSSVRNDTVVLNQEKRLFRGNEALYFEYFIPLKWHEGFGGITVVDNPPIGYSNIVFYHEGYLFWVYFASDISVPDDDYRKGVAPQVTEEIRRKFQKFLDGFEVLAGMSRT